MGISQLVHEVRPKNITTARPGKVGSVGEVIVRTRFRQSCATMPWSYDPYWTGERANKLGSNVQNGNTKSYDSKGGPANTTLKGWNGNRSFKHQYGYTMHDVQAPDTTHIQIIGGLPKFSWNRKIARTRNVKGGSLFMPMGYTATGKPRGGLYPTSTGFGGTTPASQAYDPDNAPVVDLGDNNPIPEPEYSVRAGPSAPGAQRVGVRMERGPTRLNAGMAGLRL